MKAQSGFFLLEPVLMMVILVDFYMPNAPLGATMLGLSLLALICQVKHKASNTIVR